MPNRAGYLLLTWLHGFEQSSWLLALQSHCVAVSDRDTGLSDELIAGVLPWVSVEQQHHHM